MPSEILVKEIYFPDSKISFAFFVSARIDIPLYRRRRMKTGILHREVKHILDVRLCCCLTDRKTD